MGLVFDKLLGTGSKDAKRAAFISGCAGESLNNKPEESEAGKANVSKSHPVPNTTNHCENRRQWGVLALSIPWSLKERRDRSPTHVHP